MALILSGSTGISTTSGTTPFADGSIETAQLANDAVTTPKIAEDSVTIDKISATGTPSSSNFLRGDGSWQTVAGGVTSLNGETGAITNTNYGAIGSYVVAYDNTVNLYGTDTLTLPNTTTAGSNLLRGNSPRGSTDLYSVGQVPMTSLGLSGTWRRMSSAQPQNLGSSAEKGNFLLVRIS